MIHSLTLQFKLLTADNFFFIHTGLARKNGTLAFEVENWHPFPHFSSSIVRAGDAIYVRVGDHDLTQKYGSPGAQTLRVATTYIHHNHNSQTLDNDIAILKLHGEADLKEGVCLVCLPARGTSQQAGKKCTVTGYGYMGESEYISTLMCTHLH